MVELCTGRYHSLLRADKQACLQTPCDLLVTQVFGMLSQHHHNNLTPHRERYSRLYSLMINRQAVYI